MHLLYELFAKKIKSNSKATSTGLAKEMAMHPRAGRLCRCTKERGGKFQTCQDRFQNMLSEKYSKFKKVRHALLEKGEI